MSDLLPLLQEGDKSITHIGQITIPNGMQHDGMPINFFRDNFQASSWPNQELFYLEPVAKCKSASLSAIGMGQDEIAKQIVAVTNHLIRIVREQTGLAFIIDYLVYIENWDCTVMATAFIIEKKG